MIPTIARWLTRFSYAALLGALATWAFGPIMLAYALALASVVLMMSSSILLYASAMFRISRETLSQGKGKGGEEENSDGAAPAVR